MRQNFKNTSFAAKAVYAGFATLLLTLSPAGAQSHAVTSLEETAPALPVDEAALAAASIGEAIQGKGIQPSRTPDNQTTATVVSDYAEKIGTGLKERERRLILLNEAMMKLREAGEMEDAERIEERIRALLEMPEPSQAGSKLRAEVEQMRTKNDELILQMVAMEEELKRYRGPSGAAAGRKNGSR